MDGELKNMKLNINQLAAPFRSAPADCCRQNGGCSSAPCSNEKKNCIS